ncbi:MAG: hypothetical protein N2C14_29600 [Planctomycetales bacterium]
MEQSLTGTLDGRRDDGSLMIAPRWLPIRLSDPANQPEEFQVEKSTSTQTTLGDPGNIRRRNEKRRWKLHAPWILTSLSGHGNLIDEETKKHRGKQSRSRERTRYPSHSRLQFESMKLTYCVARMVNFLYRQGGDFDDL